MAEQNEQTCGQGLAEHSVLPAKLAEVADALAENLERHITALVPTDEDASREREVYDDVARRLRDAASALGAAAGRMAAARDLPMAAHDETALAEPSLNEAFTRFVSAQEELSTVLKTALERDRQMLDAIRNS